MTDIIYEDGPLEQVLLVYDGGEYPGSDGLPESNGQYSGAVIEVEGADSFIITPFLVYANLYEDKYSARMDRRELTGEKRYYFQYWTDIKGKKYYAGDSITLSADITVNNVVILTAHWNTETYSNSQPLPVLEKDTQKQQYFLYWKDDNNMIWNDPSNYPITPDMTEVNLYAEWQQYFILYFDSEGGIGGPTLIEAPVGDRGLGYGTIPNNVPTKYGKQFNCWRFLDPMIGDSNDYRPGDSIIVPLDQFSLTARWIDLEDVPPVVTKQNGEWKQLSGCLFKMLGVWKHVVKILIKENGEWKTK